MTTTEAENVILMMNNTAIPEEDRYKGVINAKLKKNKLKWKRGETARKFSREPIKRYMHLLPELLSYTTEVELTTWMKIWKFGCSIQFFHHFAGKK